MSNKKLLINLATELDFKTELEYFEYIVESQVNGQPKQVSSLYDAMKPNDKISFKDWVKYGCGASVSHRIKTLRTLNLIPQHTDKNKNYWCPHNLDNFGEIIL